MPTILRSTIAICVVAVSCIACADNPRDSSAPAAPAAVQGGMRVHVDPETGEFLDKPPAKIQPQTEQNRAPAVQPLEERDAPGGGKMVDLEGRYKAQSGTSD